MIHQSFNYFYGASNHIGSWWGQWRRIGSVSKAKRCVAMSWQWKGVPAQGTSGKRGMWWGRTDGGEFPELWTDGGSRKVPTNKHWQRQSFSFLCHQKFFFLIWKEANRSDYHAVAGLSTELDLNADIEEARCSVGARGASLGEGAETRRYWQEEELRGGSRWWLTNSETLLDNPANVGSFRAASQTCHTSGSANTNHSNDIC